MSDRKSKKRNVRTVFTKTRTKTGDTSEAEKMATIQAVRNLLDALCEEPFESEIENEDVSALRAELARRARLYAPGRAEQEFRPMATDEKPLKPPSRKT